MHGVKEVRQLDDTHLHWVAEINGQTEEWDAEITEQTPDQRVAWKSTTGAPNAGVVTFHRLDANETKVTLQMEWQPQGMMASNIKEVGMADHDAARSAVPKKADAGANGTAPMTSAPDPAREQGRGDTQGNAVQEAEREQERQLAEGTESPG
jgi:hypothetical protein